MTAYEQMLDIAVDRGLIVKEVPLVFYDGLIKGDRIGIRSTIDTEAEKCDVLAEEIAHYELTVGNILDQSDTNNRKQERKARGYAHEMRLGIDRIVEAIEMGCENPYEAAEYLGVSEKFFCEALDYYKQKYGICVETDDYILIFEPSINIIKTGEAYGESDQTAIGNMAMPSL